MNKNNSNNNYSHKIKVILFLIYLRIRKFSRLIIFFLLIPIFWNNRIILSRLEYKLSWQLVEVIDGDSFIARNGIRKLQIKLCGITASTEESRLYLQSLLSERDLIIDTVDKKQGQTIAEVFVREERTEIHVNSQMLTVANINNNYHICPNGDNLIRAKK